MNDLDVLRSQVATEGSGGTAEGREAVVSSVVVRDAHDGHVQRLKTLGNTVSHEH
jgi:hypothetical protein